MKTFLVKIKIYNEVGDENFRQIACSKSKNTITNANLSTRAEPCLGILLPWISYAGSSQGAKIRKCKMFFTP